MKQRYSSEDFPSGMAKVDYYDNNILERGTLGWTPGAHRNAADGTSAKRVKR